MGISKICTATTSLDLVLVGNLALSTSFSDLHGMSEAVHIDVVEKLGSRPGGTGVHGTYTPTLYVCT